MAIRWHDKGWDCDGCGEHLVSPHSLKALALSNDYPAMMEYSGILKSAHDHSRHCPSLNEMGQEPRDYDNDGLNRLNDALKQSEYNGGVPDVNELDPFQGMGHQLAGNVDTGKTGPPAIPDKLPEPETVAAGISRILAASLPHAQRQAKVAPHENYRLRPEDRTSGHPNRPN